MGSKLGAAVSFATVGLAAAVAAGYAAYNWPGIGTLQPWQLTLMLTGAPGILLAFLIFTFREPPRRERAPAAAEPSGFASYLWRNIAVLGLIIAGMMLMSMAVLGLGAWTPTYIERQFGLKPQQYGPIIALIQFVAAGVLVFKGMFVDWLYARGVVDAHMRFLSWLTAGAVPLVLIAFLSNSLTLFWICDAIVEIMAGQFVTYIAATTQLIVPTQFRGRIMALYQAAFTIGGMGTGPLVVAFVTERVFADPQRLGQSLAIVAPTAFFLSFLAFRAVLPKARRALSEEGNVHAG
jgi:MFS family permease